MAPMDKLLWESMTNLLTIITVQLKYLADVGAIDATARDLCRDRIAALRSIGDNIAKACDSLDSRLAGADDVDFDANQMMDDIGEFLKSIGDS